jgi:hypothetical protein
VFREDGTFEVFVPDPASSELGDPVFSGCVASTGNRLML